MAVAGHGLGKHLFTSTNAQATPEELLEEIISMWSSLRLYNENQHDKPELSRS
jgi:truncated hemoglobin YjbI